MDQLLDAKSESMKQIIEEEQTYRMQVAALSQMQLQAMKKVEVQEKELWRLSALLEEHQALWDLCLKSPTKSLPHLLI